MMQNIDLIVVITYLMITLIVGIYKGRGSNTISSYALAGRNYTTSMLVATIAATWLGAGSSIGLAEKVFTHGIIFVLVFFGDAFEKLFFIARLIAPRISKFYGMISVGEIIGSVYGKRARIVAGICGTLTCMGALGVQISAIGYLFEYFLGISHLVGILTACGIVVIYSSFGGIRAVAATDVIQFFIIIVIIPIVSNVALSHVGGYKALFEALPKSHQTLIPAGDSPLKYITLFILFAIPSLRPYYIQRLLMSRDVSQIRKSMYFAATIDVIFYQFIGIIGLCALVIAPDIKPNFSMPYLINDILPVGIKGLAIAGIFAVIMSTADSILNAVGITLVHDVIRPLTNDRMVENKEVKLIKILTFVLGCLSIFVSLKYDSILEIWVASYLFWSPIVLVPLYAAIFGYKGNEKTFIMGACFGIACALIWVKFDLEAKLGFDCLVPSMIFNFIGFSLARKIYK